MDTAVEMANSDPDRVVPSVLLVDDRPENLLALEGVLKPLGARLVKARSGEDALLHLLRETFAVILLDVQMPRLDGLQTAELIKQREQTRHIPIIFITALSRETAYIFKGYEQGAVDYLLKPIDPEILRAKVRVFCDLFVRGEMIRMRSVESDAKDVFLADVIHELKTPLAAAKAQAQLALHQLGDRRTDATTARSLRLISQQIDRLNRLVGDLLEASRLEAGSVELQTSQFDLSALLEEMRNRMQPLGDRHPIRINAPEKLSLIADKDRIEQVLANLLSNAIRYSPEGGPIEVDAETTGDGVHIQVRDRGLGIPREHQQLVFERFGRAHGTAFGGLGLGLAISKGIVERHGGRIWVESTGRPGEGSVFHVQLPLATPPAQT
ncbi:MAG: hybrid sensor histidine kinase/response regulator [Deltaproteobacteria bacterium]|nr:MAG: hybrid sensor histidine kinase/response regulator [Deltaproteobacteria bacterium]